MRGFDWRRTRIAIALIVLAGFAFTLWIFYPGVKTFDSLALKAVNDALNDTVLFRSGTWLIVDLVLCLIVWRRRDTPTGTFVIGVCGTAAIYILSFSAVGVSTDLRYAFMTILAALAGTVAALAAPEKPELAAPL